MRPSRRDLLMAAPAVAVGYLSGRVLGQPQTVTEAVPSKGFRLAHLTDIHIMPGREPESSFARAVELAQTQGAELFVNGGDTIQDALITDRQTVDRYWATYHRLLRDHNSVPWLNVVGNHDIFGWGGDQPDPGGKQEVLDHLKLDRAYYSLEKAGWKLIVLDSIGFAPDRPKGYAAFLGQEQLDWLESELTASTLPVCIISHIPIISACAFFDGQNERTGNWLVPGEWMHLDARLLKEMFARHPNVKLCLSGHIHLVDSLRYANVEYFCNGAVCGYYWKGPYQGFGPGYALVDLFPDGSYHHQMVYY